jgi:hypothetical protein
VALSGGGSGGRGRGGGGVRDLRRLVSPAGLLFPLCGLLEDLVGGLSSFRPLLSRLLHLLPEVRTLPVEMVLLFIV